MKLQRNAFLLSCLITFSCANKTENQEEKVIEETKKTVLVDSIRVDRVVKKVTRTNETNTDYEYKYDWWNGKFRQQPVITSQTKFFVVFTNGDVEEVSKERGMFLEKGDTITHYKPIYETK